MTSQPLDLLQDLIKATREGRQAIDDRIERAMREAGCRVDRFDYVPANVPLVDEFATHAVAAPEPERCLIGRLDGDEDAPSLILFAHPDTEPPTADHGWSGDPHKPTERRGRLHGFGVADDLAGIAMLTGALDALSARGQRPKGDVILASAPSKRHRRGIAALLHAGLSADAAIYLHPAESGRGLNDIKAFAPGQLEFTIDIAGRPPDTLEPAHTAFAHQAVNPFDKAIQIAATLKAYDDNRAAEIHHPRLQAAIGRSTNLMLTSCQFGDPPPSSRIAANCRLGGAISLIPGEIMENVQAEIEQTIQLACRTDPWLTANPPQVTWLAGVSGAETASDHKLYQTAQASLARHGGNPQVNPLHTSSDIRNPIVQKNIPTVGYGPLCGNLTQAGFRDEWVDIADFKRSIEATADIVANWCGVAGR